MPKSSKPFSLVEQIIGLDLNNPELNNEIGQAVKSLNENEILNLAIEYTIIAYNQEIPYVDKRNAILTLKQHNVITDKLEELLLSDFALLFIEQLMLLDLDDSEQAESFITDAKSLGPIEFKELYNAIYNLPYEDA